MGNLRSATIVALACVLAVPLMARAGGSTSAVTGAGKKKTVLLPALSPSPSPSPSPTPTPTPTPAATPTATPTLAALPPLDLRDMRLWNYAAKWHASEWANAFSPIPWKFDHVIRQANGDVVFRLDSVGAPELQGVGGTPAYTRGLWETEVTVPQLRDGLVVAPLWLYDQTSKDEIDFEFAGRKGLDVSLHTSLNGAMVKTTVRLFAGTDFSGRRMRFGINLDQAAGTAEMLVDGIVVHRLTRASLGYFVSRPVKPFMEMWAADPRNAGFNSWLGQWQGIAPGEALTMTVHGYRFTPL